LWELFGGSAWAAEKIFAKRSVLNCFKYIRTSYINFHELCFFSYKFKPPRLKSQSWQVATKICPKSDLKPSKSCQRFTREEWSFLAFSLYPEFIGVSTICRDYLGVCPPPKERWKTQRLNLAPLDSDAENLSCPTCLIALAATASFMADRNVEGEMVDFLAQNFCKHELHLTDRQYCPQFVKEIIPRFAPSTMAEQVSYCRELFQLC